MDCKYCQSDHVIKYGTHNGIQRFYCRSCNRKFVSGDTLLIIRGCCLSFRGLYCQLRKLRRRLIDTMSAWATAIGAMLIPLAMVWIFEAPRDLPELWVRIPAFLAGLLGFILIIIGLSKGLSDDHKRHKLEDAREKRDIARERRELEAEQRNVDEHTEYIEALSQFARLLGANSIVFKRRVNRAVEREKTRKELKTALGITDKENTDDEL